MDLLQMQLLAGIPITSKKATMTEATNDKPIVKILKNFIYILDTKISTTKKRDDVIQLHSLASDLEDISILVKAGKQSTASKLYKAINNAYKSKLIAELKGDKLVAFNNYFNNLSEMADLAIVPVCKKCGEEHDKKDECILAEDDAMVWDVPHDKDESPYQFSKDLDVIKLPKDIRKSLETEIIELQAEVEKIVKKDFAHANFLNGLANHMITILDYLKAETEEDMKMAQIHITKLANTYTSRFPANVWKFIIGGGYDTTTPSHNSLTAVIKK